MKSDENTTLSLIIPCYNEEKNIPELYERCEKVAANRGVEVILVDNGSTDGSRTILHSLSADNMNIRLVLLDINQGYGDGIMAGLSAAKGEFLGWCHADLQTDPADVLRAYEVIKLDTTRLTFVAGRRYGRPIFDTLFTFGMSVFESILLRRFLWDINAQPKLFPKSFFSKIRDNAPDDFSLDLYFYYCAKLEGAKIKRFPVRFSSRIYGNSSWNTGFVSRYKFIKRTVAYSFKLLRKFHNA